MFNTGTIFSLFGNTYTVTEIYPKTVDVCDGFFFVDDLTRWYESGQLSILK